MTSSAHPSGSDQFAIVRRGYAPQEVDAKLSMLSRDLQAAITEQSSSDRIIVDLRGRIGTLETELTEARAELDRQTSQPLTMSTLSTRMQRLLEIAEEEAAEIRAASDRYATDTRAKANADASRMRQDTEGELAHQRGETEAEIARMRAELEAEVARTRAELEDDRAEVDRTRTAVYEQAKRLMAEAHTEAERTLAEARAQAEHLSATAAADRAKAEEDYEIAIETRRKQAHRAVLEAEESSPGRCQAPDRSGDHPRPQYRRFGQRPCRRCSAAGHHRFTSARGRCR